MNNTLHPHRLPLQRCVQKRNLEDALEPAQPLSDFSKLFAWVLLANPGAGKTDIFQTLSQIECGHYVTARDFVDLALPAGWQEPLFIDGLDEITAGDNAGSTPLGTMRTKLQRLGPPRFRISCREADWRGNADSKALERLAGEDNFAELHLTPLNHAQILTLIAHWLPCDEAQAQAFVREAKQRDLEGLLDNPQTLAMLVKAVGGSSHEWPLSKTQTYALACTQLVQELNDEHRANVIKNILPTDQILTSAGFLCAVMLLSGAAHISLQSLSQATDTSIVLSELLSTPAAPDGNNFQAALRTRIFRGDGAGRFWPVHRTIAEYLGALYVAQRIHAGLPTNRVLALMLGEDAGIVPELRGLHAWLAAVAPAALRRDLIARDPLGVVLNGDVRTFSRADKLALLEALRSEAQSDTSFRRQNWISHPFGALATPDMAGDFLDLLQADDRSPAHQALLDCVLDALLFGPPMFELTTALERLARDKTYWPSLRSAAVAVLIAYADAGTLWPVLMRLLTDVQNKSVDDPEDDILGRLLEALYPDHIPASALWQYFRQPKAKLRLGAYWLFWHSLPKNAKPEALPDLLDSLNASSFQLEGTHDDLHSRHIVGALLQDGVTHHGEHLSAERLHSWLSLGLSVDHSCALEEGHKTALQQWLGAHPAIYKALFEYGLSTPQSPDSNAFVHVWEIEEHLYGAPTPADAKAWYLSLAEDTANDELRRELLFRAFWYAERTEGPNSAISVLEHWAALHATDANWVATQLCQPYPPPDRRQGNIDAKLRREARKAEEDRQRLIFFAKTLPKFAAEPAHLGLLALVGETYLNFYGKSALSTPRERLLELLDHRPEWVELALHGLRQCLTRTDLPTASDIIDLNLKGSMYILAAPCLAAMAMRDSENPATTLSLDRATLVTVAAFHLTSLTNQDAPWFKRLVAQEPVIVAEVMQTMIRQQLAAQKEHVDGLYALAFDPDYATIARLITPELLIRLPARTRATQLGSLRFLVITLIRRLDNDLQSQIIAAKLAIPTMDVAQQAYWLTAGLLLEPQTYLEPIRAFVGKTQKRSTHVFALIHDMRERGGWEIDLPVATQRFLIGLLGPNTSPSWSRVNGIVKIETKISRYVESMIATLAGNPADEAMHALVELRSREDMKPWLDTFSRAIYDQRIARRKALFKPATVKQVCNTLANLQPASAADLWALTVDFLAQLIRQIRDSDKDIYDQYWDGKTPKSEERCRNVLLSALEPHLSKLDISVIPERQLADKKRADIGIISGLIHIPLEAKGEWHPELWKAIDKQLITQYCREPSSEGYGIYLVFWFTGQMKAMPTDGGTKPKTPQELQQRLTATLPEAMKHKIAVLVVDCSKPLLINSR